MCLLRLKCLKTDSKYVYFMHEKWSCFPKYGQNLLTISIPTLLYIHLIIADTHTHSYVQAHTHVHMHPYIHAHTCIHECNARGNYKTRIGTEQNQSGHATLLNLTSFHFKEIIYVTGFDNTRLPRTIINI